ncbi:hypothetical protein [Bradyrhizobium iriomotense]|uniref:hypothetical protein n=1 Tax=Bradyrhizobium iriomotense TaxID=441950 RepID=UPI001FEE81A2|nr:hypothetical protein [Bradyrhizobium iriomotense]
MKFAVSSTASFTAVKAMPESASTNLGFPPGSRVQVKPEAGARLAGKTGRVIGGGFYPKSLRLVLDGSKVPITLHVNYVAAIDDDVDPMKSD